MTREHKLATNPHQISATGITTLIRRAVGIDVQDPTSDLLANGTIDSLGFVSLLLAMEQEFGMSIDINSIDLADFQSVDRITQFIILQMNRSNPSAGR